MMTTTETGTSSRHRHPRHDEPKVILSSSSSSSSSSPSSSPSFSGDVDGVEVAESDPENKETPNPTLRAHARVSGNGATTTVAVTARVTRHGSPGTQPPTKRGKRQGSRTGGKTATRVQDGTKQAIHKREKAPTRGHRSPSLSFNISLNCPSLSSPRAESLLTAYTYTKRNSPATKSPASSPPSSRSSLAIRSGKPAAPLGSPMPSRSSSKGTELLLSQITAKSASHREVEANPTKSGSSTDRSKRKATAGNPFKRPKLAATSPKTPSTSSRRRLQFHPSSSSSSSSSSSPSSSSLSSASTPALASLRKNAQAESVDENAFPVADAIDPLEKYQRHYDNAIASHGKGKTSRFFDGGLKNKSLHSIGRSMDAEADGRSNKTLRHRKAGNISNRSIGKMPKPSKGHKRKSTSFAPSATSPQSVKTSPGPGTPAHQHKPPLPSSPPPTVPTARKSALALSNKPATLPNQRTPCKTEPTRNDRISRLLLEKRDGSTKSVSLARQLELPPAFPKTPQARSSLSSSSSPSSSSLISNRISGALNLSSKKPPAARSSHAPASASGMSSAKPTVSQTFSTNPYTDSLLPDNPICGLTNLGNTCFLNSVVQCLRVFFTGSLLEDIETVYQAADATLKTDKAIHTLRPRVELAKALCELWREMDFQDQYGRRSQLCTQPHKLLAAIRNVNPVFSGHRQQDAEECLMLLLSSISDLVEHLACLAHDQGEKKSAHGVSFARDDGGTEAATVITGEDEDAGNVQCTAASAGVTVAAAVKRLQTHFTLNEVVRRTCVQCETSLDMPSSYATIRLDPTQVTSAASLQMLLDARFKASLSEREWCKSCSAATTVASQTLFSGQYPTMLSIQILRSHVAGKSHAFVKPPAILRLSSSLLVALDKDAQQVPVDAHKARQRGWTAEPVMLGARVVGESSMATNQRAERACETPAKDTLYRLKSLVLHRGRSIHAGHYICAIQPPHLSKSWLKYHGDGTSTSTSTSTSRNSVGDGGDLKPFCFEPTLAFANKHPVVKQCVQARCSSSSFPPSSSSSTGDCVSRVSFEEKKATTARRDGCNDGREWILCDDSLTKRIPGLDNALLKDAYLVFYEKLE